MGFFNFLRKEKDDKSTINRKTSTEIEKDNIKIGLSSDGRLQIDYYDMEAKFGQFYDTTRLIVGNTPLRIAGMDVYDCLVSWYSQDDCIFLDSRYGNESINARNYRSILAQIDVGLLQTSPEYCSTVMRKLLNRKRVEKYLTDGLKECPDVLCGKYVGGINQNYGKFFSVPVGMASHNSSSMINLRREYQERIVAEKKAAIEQRKAQIQRLQDEIDEFSK